MAEKYYYGQGRLELAEIVNGVAKSFIWLGDVSELSGQLGETKVQHKESYSGKKSTAREFSIEMTMEWSATLHQLDIGNVARFTLAKTSNTAAGTVTAESFPTVAVGDRVQLEHLNVSGLVLTDSYMTPLTQGTDYNYDEFGEVEILSLPAGTTQPLRAAYSYGATRQAAFLAGNPTYYALRYKGTNLAENGEKCLVELYKVSAGLLKQLSLITNGNQLAGTQVSFTSLIDTSKSAQGPLGQYGRFVVLD